MPNSGPGRARGSECLGGCEIAGEGSFDVLATLCLQSGETAVMGRIHRSLNVGAIRSALPLAEPLAAHAVPGGHAPPTPRHSSGPVLAGDWPLSRDHPTSEEPRPPPRLAPPGAPQQPAPQAAERHEEGTQQRERLRLTHKPDHWQHLSPAPPSTSALEGARAAANKKKPCAQMCDGYSVGRSPLSAVFGMLESASGGPLQARRCPMRVVLAWRAGRLLAAVPRGGLVPERLRPPEPDGCGPATRLVVWASLRTACGGPGDAAVLRISSINRFTVVGLGSVASLSSFVADSSGEQAGDAAQVLSLVLQVRHESAPWGDGELDSVAGAERQITEVAAHNDPIGVGISDANRWRRSGSDEADKEYCDGGTAFDLIHNQDIVVMSWVQRWKMAMDVAQARPGPRAGFQGHSKGCPAARLAACCCCGARGAAAGPPAGLLPCARAPAACVEALGLEPLRELGRWADDGAPRAAAPPDDGLSEPLPDLGSRLELAAFALFRDLGLALFALVLDLAVLCQAADPRCAETAGLLQQVGGLREALEARMVALAAEYSAQAGVRSAVLRAGRNVRSELEGAAHGLGGAPDAQAAFDWVAELTLATGRHARALAAQLGLHAWVRTLAVPGRGAPVFVLHDEHGSVQEMVRALVARVLLGGPASLVGVGLGAAVDPAPLLEEFPGLQYFGILGDGAGAEADVPGMPSQEVGRLTKFGARAALHRVSSGAAAAASPPRALDVVVLAAGDNFESTAEDLELWEARVKPGGILAGVNFGPRALGGVRAVCERRHSYDIHLSPGGGFWWYVEPDE
ncbi:unnamed protein product [Prorocentrum cordatum]|uniref:Uncharacterized protein n=1 Tax=Prorocentrum cordatum TaxID=2364126 RepID=A0ABN9TSZ8_9DINO|nr:unnamed protein product [Polarella glacialis]